MKIATWNVGEDERDVNEKLSLDSYNYIVDMIQQKDIDVICLQEAIIKSKYLPPITDYICKNTNLKYYGIYELSDSHINIGCRMGVVICSKYEISNIRHILLDNPNFIYSKDEHDTYYSHNKGLISCTINGYGIVTGHCLTFHVFKKRPLDYLKIFIMVMINLYCVEILIMMIFFPCFQR